MLILPSNLPSDWFFTYQATNSTWSDENAISIDSDAKYDEARSVCFLGIMVGGRGTPRENFGVCLLRTCVCLPRTEFVRHWRTKNVFRSRTIFWSWNFARLFMIASCSGSCPHVVYNLRAVLHSYSPITIWIVQNVNFVQFNIYAISWIVFAQLSFINHFYKSTFNIWIPARMFI